MEIFASDKDHGLGIQGQQPLFLVEKVTFPSLKKIIISGANKLLTAFQFNMFERFSRLESLTVSNCDSLEQIFGLQGEHFEESHSHSALVTQLRELHIIKLSKLKHIWYKDPQQMFSFQKLQKVRVSHCQRLKSLFPAPVAMNLLQLEHLHVHKCGLEEIVAEEREATAVPRFVFPWINALTLKELHELRTFYPGIHSLEWPALKKLEVLDCDKIEILFMSKLFDFHENYEGQLGISVRQPPFMVEKVTFPKLEEIKIRGAHNLKIIWQKQLAEDSFCNLKSIEVEGCNKLRTLSQSNTLEIFLRLESLYVIDCDAIEEIFDLRGINFEKPDHSPAVCELRELNIHKLPKLKNIWNAYPQGMLFSFQKLHKVRVYECQSLKNLFPASIASNLLQLEEVDMYDCGVEEIVARESEFAKAATIRFVFPQMTSLKLKELPQLTTFYPGLHSSEWPVLKKLQVFGCDKIELLASEQENNIDSQLHISLQPSLFSAKKIGPQGSFPKLEELELRGEGMKMISGQFSEHLFRKLNFLEVYDVSSAVFPIGILQKFLGLEKLVLNFSLYKEIFSCEKTEKPARMMLPQIKALHLHHLCELKHIWKQNSELDLILQNLEKLKVMNCNSLTDHLVPSWSYFRILTILHVWNCNGLRNLVTSTTAKSLMRLVEMRVGVSRMLVEIVANDQGDIVTEDEIIFDQLKNLSLYYLPSFTGFCSANYTFKFPSLEQLTVTECPKMKIFSPGVLSTPMLQTLRNSKSGDYIWEGDLNTTIRRMHEEKVGELKKLIDEGKIKYIGLSEASASTTSTIRSKSSCCSSDKSCTDGMVLMVMRSRHKEMLGTEKVGYTFAPIICVWFVLIGGIGTYNIIKFEPTMIRAVNPWIAVVFVLTLTSFLLVLLMIIIWNILLIIYYVVIIGSLELAYLSSVLYKFDQGGYLPLAFVALLMTVMFVWNNVYQKKYYYEFERKISSKRLKEIALDRNAYRIPGLAMFCSELVQGIPPIFKHYAANVPALHSVLVFVSMKSLLIIKVPLEEWFIFRRVEPKELNVFHCVARYGYTDVQNKEEEHFESMLIEKLKEFIIEDYKFHPTTTDPKKNIVEVESKDLAE
ncbi:hypothetical protein EZV62_004439 [Acer yangbiense]|uniref:Uncharacterized protein n=1 Tax=Acer yangbiense TaxID=1000413 RepID=A0A5C7IKU1_9ROSI|nr:hypothetical protein EZV62_004439 [Acer yangbiense]